MGKKSLTKITENIQESSNGIKAPSKETKPRKDQIKKIETKPDVEDAKEIYTANIPLEWTRKDMIEYLVFDDRIHICAVKSLKYKVYGVQLISKIAIITFKEEIDIAKFNESINNQKFNAKKPSISVKFEFTKVYESKQPTTKSKEAETKNSNKNKLQKNIKAIEDTEPTTSKPQNKTTVELKDSTSEIEGMTTESTPPTNVIGSPDEKSVEKHKHKYKQKKSNNTIYISNIPYDISRKQLAAFLKVEEESVSLPMRKLQDLRTGKIFTSKISNKGYSFIKFEDCDTNEPIEQKVEQLQGQTLDNRRLIIDIAIIKEKYSDYIKPTTIISVKRS